MLPRSTFLPTIVTPPRLTAYGRKHFHLHSQTAVRGAQNKLAFVPSNGAGEQQPLLSRLAAVRQPVRRRQSSAHRYYSHCTIERLNLAVGSEKRFKSRACRLPSQTKVFAYRRCLDDATHKKQGNTGGCGSATNSDVFLDIFFAVPLTAICSAVATGCVEFFASIKCVAEKEKSRGIQTAIHTKT